MKRTCVQFARKMHRRISDTKLGNNLLSDHVGSPLTDLESAVAVQSLTVKSCLTTSSNDALLATFLWSSPRPLHPTPTTTSGEGGRGGNGNNNKPTLNEGHGCRSHAVSNLRTTPSVRPPLPSATELKIGVFVWQAVEQSQPSSRGEAHPRGGEASDVSEVSHLSMPPTLLPLPHPP